MDNSILILAEVVWPSGPEDERLFPVGEGHGRDDSLVLGNMRHLILWFCPQCRPSPGSGEGNGNVSQWFQYHNPGRFLLLHIYIIGHLGGNCQALRVCLS